MDRPLQLAEDDDNVGDNIDEEDLTLPELMSCFAITSEMFDRMDPEKPEAKLLRSRGVTAPGEDKFFEALCKACHLKKGETTDHLLRMGVKSKNLLEVSTDNFVSRWAERKKLLLSLTSTTRSVIEVCFDLLLNPDADKASVVELLDFFIFHLGSFILSSLSPLKEAKIDPFKPEIILIF